MQVKEYMKMVRSASEELKLINAQQEALMEMGTNISPTLEKIGGRTGPSSRVENAGVGLADLAADLEGKRVEYERIICDAQAMIGKLDSVKFRRILTLYYLGGKELPEIGKELQYKDSKSVYRAHGYALQALNKLVDITTIPMVE